MIKYLSEGKGDVYDALETIDVYKQEFFRVASDADIDAVEDALREVVYLMTAAIDKHDFRIQHKR